MRTTAPTDTLSQVQDALLGSDLQLVKSVPKGPGRLLLELRGPDAEVLAGQWYQDTERADVVAQQTRHTAADPAFVQRLGARVVVQRAGADRRLPALHHRATRVGAALVAHRAERRGVVANPDGSYTKVVTPARLPQLLRIPSGAADLRVPKVLSVDEPAAAVTTAGLPGRSLHRLLCDETVTEAEITAAGHSVGDAVAALHRGAVPVSVPVHDAAAEIEVTRAWLDAALAHHALSDAAGLYRGLASARARLTETGPSVFVQRDLHDGQLLVASGEPVGMLDFDLAAAGPAAADVANLLVHLELRTLQGCCSAARAQQLTTAILDAYQPTATVAAQLVGYSLTTRLRLAAVYAFRPGGARLSRSLIQKVEVSS